MNELPPIENAQSVFDVYGYFPVFHDAEILYISCDRGQKDMGSPIIRFRLHGWEMESETDSAGHYKLTKHHLIDFQFDSVDAVALNHFNHQNVLFELVIEKIENPNDHALIKVDFSSSFGLEGGFRAISGKVNSIRPCTATGQELR